MKSYIGTKVVQAEPMTRHEWLKSQGGIYSGGDSKIPEDGPGYKVGYDDGYTSWSPKGVFERCYREITEEEKKLITPMTGEHQPLGDPEARLLLLPRS